MTDTNKFTATFTAQELRDFGVCVLQEAGDTIGFDHALYDVTDDDLELIVNRMLISLYGIKVVGA